MPSDGIGERLQSIHLNPGSSPCDTESLFRPPPVLCPDRSSFSRALETANRKLSLAHTHESNRQYEIAYPLYLSSATGFLWAHTNLHNVGLPGDRIPKLRETLMRQTKKALQRAENIKAARGADWARRWSGSRRRTDIESQAKVLNASSTINGLEFKPWIPGITSTSAHPSPALSEKQRREGAHLRSFSATSRTLWDDEAVIEGSSITQDAVTNCGLVAAMEVIAEHDLQWGTTLLSSPFLSSKQSLTDTYSIRLHFNGCPRHVVVDDQLPFASTRTDMEPPRLMCACLRAKTDEILLLPSLVEKAYLTIQGSYAPPGSVPAEDLHALTGWIPEVIDLHHGSFQREKTWQRLQWGAETGRVLICAGTASSSSVSSDQEANERMLGTGPLGLIPAHSYAVLRIHSGHLHLMNPWRPDNTKGSHESSPFQMQWTDFCRHFATLHLAWNSLSLFQHRDEVHASWSGHASEDTVAGDPGESDSSASLRIRNVSFTLKITPDGDATAEQDGEVWLHLSRHLSKTQQSADEDEKRFIAVHIFESSSSQEVRVVPLSAGGGGSGSSRNSSEASGLYVDSAHHLVRFKPNFYLRSILRSEEPGLPSSTNSSPLAKEYEVVVSLHGARDDDEVVNFSLWAWADHKVSLEDASEDGEARWVSNMHGQWNELTSGGHRLHKSFHQNPQYLLTVPPNSPASTLRLSLVASPPELPVHIYIVHPSSASSSSTTTRVDAIEKANTVAESGSYSYGLTRVKAKLASTPAHVTARYHIILSTYEPGTPGKFALSIESQDVQVLTTRGSAGTMRIADGSIARPRQVMHLQALPLEGAGMFQKRLKGRWSTQDGSAAGAPRHGRYLRNPTWIIKVKSGAAQTQARCIFRLLVVSDAAATAATTPQSTPQLNLALFSNTQCNTEVATSGSYTVAPCGVVIHDVRLEKDKEYVLVASTFSPDFEGAFELAAWCEVKEWDASRVT